MKKILSLISLISIICASACNDGADKKAEDVKTDSSNAQANTTKCPGNWNITLSKEEAEEMILRYRSIYNKQNLADSIWIDALVIRSLGAFLESTKGQLFDGVRFFNGAPADNNETILMMVPTKPKADPILHENIWGTVFTLIAPDAVSYPHYNNNYAGFGEERINRFETEYRENGTVAGLTKNIWMNRCVFIELARLMNESRQTTDEITGISVLFGAYNKIIPEVRGLANKDQSTIIIVPTSSDGVGGHSNRWDIIKTKIIKMTDAGYNHGELCPQKCD